jgi:hypothetical protein
MEAWIKGFRGLKPGGRDRVESSPYLPGKYNFFTMETDKLNGGNIGWF